MKRVVRSVLMVVLLIVLVVCVVAAVAAPLTVRRSFPKTAGEIQLSGLDAPVDVYRDALGVPHI